MFHFQTQHQPRSFYIKEIYLFIVYTYNGLAFHPKISIREPNVRNPNKNFLFSNVRFAGQCLGMELKYSRCPKSERNLVLISDIWISDIRAVPFVRFFGYIINVRNPNVRLVESNNRTSEIGTVWKWDNFGQRQNLNVQTVTVKCLRTELVPILAFHCTF